MNRRNFVSRTCAICLSGSLSQLLDGCSSTHYVSGTWESNGISVSPSEFQSPEKKPGEYLPYIVVRNEKLEYPICLYRFSEREYSALLMKCTHQGTELQAGGDHLHCPAHGSEFNNRGRVAQGPAETDLRSFRVIPLEQKLLIELK